MEWMNDVAAARAGEVAARERLREYLTPFVHGVCVAHAAHHHAAVLVPRVFDVAFATLSPVEPHDVGRHVVTLARRLAQDLRSIEEEPSVDAARATALQVVTQLRVLDAPLRELFVLRLLEGIPGVELAEVLRLPPADVRRDLELAAAHAATRLGQPHAFTADAYLWELVGTPHPLLARLEMQLPVLRYDPLATPSAPAAPDTAGTHHDLQPVGSLGAPGAQVKSLRFKLDDVTSLGEVNPSLPDGTEASVVTTPAPPAANPFDVEVRTIAATDLPAEARGQLPQAPPAPMVPWDDSPSARSGKQAQLPPRPVPAVSANEVSSKSSKSGRSQPQVEGSGKKPNPSTGTSGPRFGDDGPERTEAKVPEPIQRRLGEEAMLGKPTMVMPLSAAVQVDEATVSEVESQPTRLAPLPPLPPPAHAVWTSGTTPLFITVVLLLLAGGVTWAGLATTEKRARAGWELVPVVVAAEDLDVGDLITLENVAKRSVPIPYQGANVVKADALPFILEQKLASSVQQGDPIFYSHFIATRSLKGLAERVQKKARAFTIAVNTRQAVGRWVRPGDLVDVVCTINTVDTRTPQAQARGTEPRSATFLQKVLVMATGQATENLSEAALEERDRQFGDVTLLLTPEEGEMVALAASLGRLTLTLRNPEDNEAEMSPGFSNIGTLIEGNRNKALQAKRFNTIQQIRAEPRERGPRRR